jgi:GDP-L-fucose synthase
LNNKFYNKKILVAGGTGLVGQELTSQLLKMGAIVSICSLDSKDLAPVGVSKYYKLDMSILSNCRKACRGNEIVFSLLGATGSPLTNFNNPATFMMGNLLTALNILEGARLENVKEFLYTSTYGVYSNKGPMIEDKVWENNPSENDKFAGWAKRIGELQVEAYKKQYKWKKIYIVRPANIYGPYSNFDEKNSMVVASLIKKFLSKKDVVKIWGDGSPVRDFIYSEDVARMMIKVVENEITQPINLGSGKGVSISDLVNIILNSKYLKQKPKVKFEKDKPMGDSIRVLDMSFAKKFNICATVSLQEGINKTISWYLENKNIILKKFNVFNKTL